MAETSPITDLEQRLAEARATAMREGLEEAARIRDTFVSADYGTEWDRGLKQGMDEYQGRHPFPSLLTSRGRYERRSGSPVERYAGCGSRNAKCERQRCAPARTRRSRGGWSMNAPTEFHIKIAGGPEQTIKSQTSTYVWAVAALPALLGIDIPADVEIWVPELVAAGYGPYRYRLEHDNYGRPVVSILIRDLTSTSQETSKTIDKAEG